MHHFEHRNGRLYAEDVDVAALAGEIGTPFYVYSEATLRRHVRVFATAFAGADPLVAFSVKANSNLAVLKILASEGAGADVVSAGELMRALKAGIAPENIVFSGVGKTGEEMKAALDAGIYQFNVESAPELEALNDVALALGKRAPMAMRVNPDVAAGGHDKISTGRKEDKFGVAWDDARALYAHARGLDGIEVVGVDFHIGSQISDLAPFEAAFTKAAGLIADLRADGCTIDRLDVGGGLGIPYGDKTPPPHPDDYAGLIKKLTAPLDVRLIFEPGRMIAGNAGILVTQAIYVKEGEARTFLIVDAAMNDLIRPALYDAHHEIQPVLLKENAPEKLYDVVGPVCESSDFFAKQRALPEFRAGDYAAIMSAGAYGAVQASQYNTRPLVPEVMVNGDKHAVIRRRPTFEEMLALETTPDWLS
ncbi:diaminopimelate decarboxylase [Hyphococcus luteus]|uniref:Diaminopimelate decarboxylase n=1 Tax=Hyphococcus luteus TaxID=2058213 RepID=A0A2S7K646_9PROT|nr:diaminopimelate decarboxylase [Marinicaulis flavus]PQA87946.1 diaminopimelate decarboxylase [Marinicaulis flavus]